jgi:hypothetical protein
MKRKERPNLTRRCRFYKYGTTLKDSEPVTNVYGELEQSFSLIAVGLFAKEKPYRANEAEEGDRTIGEQRHTLTGRYTTSLSNVSATLYCYILSERKLYAVSGNATDPYGDKQWIWIDIVDNVTQDIVSKFPGAKL